MSLNLIYARARNGVIGRDNQMPWHLPEDLAHFKRTTLGHPVLMGRKTWDSLPHAFKPLPGRLNLVVSRQHDWHANGAQLVHSVEHALKLCPLDNQLWVIGGAQIYAQTMPLAERLVVTEIDADFDGDAFAPEIDPVQWQESSRTSHISAKGLSFHFVTYTRCNLPPGTSTL